MKRHDCCANCGYLTLSHMFGTLIYDDYYCEINNKKIEYPREMGGRSKCPCYMTKAEYREENKRKAIENHVYPQKSEMVSKERNKVTWEMRESHLGEQV